MTWTPLLSLTQHLFLFLAASLTVTPSFGSALVHKNEKTRTLDVYAAIRFRIAGNSKDLGDLAVMEIQSVWNNHRTRVFIDQQWYSVRFHVVRVGPGIVVPFSCAMNTYRIENASAEEDRSKADIGGSKGLLLTSNVTGRSTTAAHEFGHGLGLLDEPAGDVRRDAPVPGIMFPRGTLMRRPDFQYDPKAILGKPGSTLDPRHRRVRPEDIGQLGFRHLKFTWQNLACLGDGLPIWPGDFWN